jgi:glycosyltransferase involved in cell wall biosynthesis
MPDAALALSAPDENGALGDESAGGERAVILHIITGLTVGGAERMLEKLATFPSASRHVVVSLSDLGPIGEAMKCSGVEVYALEMAGPLSVGRGIRRLRAIARTLRPTAVQGWMTHGNLIASLLWLTGLGKAALFWGVRQSVNFTGERRRTKLLTYFSIILARTPDAIVYNSQVGARQHEAIGYPPAKRRVIPNGFDLEKYRPSPRERAATRSRLDVAEGNLLVGIIARVHPVKNHRGFLEAAAMLAPEYPEARFLLAGRGVDMAHKLFASMVAEAGIDPARLILLDELADVASVMRCLDIAANVSVAESFPNVVGEALACGVPCVVTPVGDSEFLVGDAGIVCKGVDGPAIADAIRLLIEEGPVGRAARSARGVERVRELFSLPVVVAEFSRLYRSAS